MKAYVFPGQGAQFSGMGSDLFESSNEAKAKFERANDILGFNISEIMFNGTENSRTGKAKKDEEAQKANMAKRVWKAWKVNKAMASNGDILLMSFSD